jgi:hypothetical protein
MEMPAACLHINPPPFHLPLPLPSPRKMPPSSTGDREGARLAMVDHADPNGGPPPPVYEEEAFDLRSSTLPVTDDLRSLTLSPTLSTASESFSFSSMPEEMP